MNCPAQEISPASIVQSTVNRHNPETIATYINNKTGITRTSLNIRALIGLFIFGWLMKMNYDDLGEKGFGWALLISLSIVLAVSRQIKPMFFVVGLVIYLAAWIHTNMLLTEKQRIAREEFFKENS